MKPAENFSQDEIDKRVNHQIHNHSLTLFPAAAGVLMLLWGGLFASSIALVLGGLSLGVSLGFLAYQKKVKFPELSEKLVETLRNQQLKELKEKLSPLKTELEQLNCSQGAEQVHRLKIKFDDLSKMIQEKLSHDHANAARLNAIAEQLYLATIENLIQAKQILTSVANINEQYIDTQIQRAHSDEERESLLERKQVLKDGQHAAEDCIANNEVAMTKINQLSMQLAKSKNSKFDMEHALHEITNNVRVEQWQSE
ncbi:hypothetical protein [Rubritalea tangerina]|uniref:Uncharacterized protein n=1 Tax=Rubritalea tangerina TaxID=430798 RepID=A0ABW4ZB55_9BACT